MRKLLVAFLLFSLSIGYTHSQVFKEDFNSGTSLSSWTLIDVDGRTPANAVSQYVNAWILVEDSSFSDSCASSTSWYNPLGQADDWMVSPAISLSSSNILSWDAEAVDNRFPDGYEVRISTTTPDTAAFFSNPPLFVIAAENPFWTRRSINLQASGYANQTVYLAWRNNSDDEYILNIDNIQIDAISGNDAKMLTALDIVDEYTQIPFKQVDTISFLGVIENVGADTLYNLKAICEVYRNGNLIHIDSTQAVSSLAPTDTALLINPNGFQPALRGDYYVKYYPRFNGVDSDSTNNFYITDTLTVSDSTYARDDGNILGSIGIGSNIVGELGTTYRLDNPDTLSSVSVYIRNQNGQMTGQPLSLNIRSFNSVPTAIISSSDTITYTSAGASWVNFSFSQGVSGLALSPGLFFIGVVEPLNNVTLGVTNRIFTTNVNYIRFQGGITNGWNPMEDYSFRSALAIRPHFADHSLIVGLKKSVVDTEDYLIYPNPSSDGRFNIETRSSALNLNFRVFNLSGEKLFDQRQMNDSKVEIDLSKFAKGIYFLEIQNGGKSTIKKLIVH